MVEVVALGVPFELPLDDSRMVGYSPENIRISRLFSGNTYSAPLYPARNLSSDEICPPVGWNFVEEFQYHSRNTASQISHILISVLSECGPCPQTVHCGQSRCIDLGKRYRLIIETSCRWVFGPHGDYGQSGVRSYSSSAAC
jgi:hypothetical protein